MSEEATPTGGKATFVPPPPPPETAQQVNDPPRSIIGAWRDADGNICLRFGSVNASFDQGDSAPKLWRVELRK